MIFRAVLVGLFRIELDLAAGEDRRQPTTLAIRDYH
jgi:hypothetical protein